MMLLFTPGPELADGSLVLSLNSGPMSSMLGGSEEHERGMI